MQQKKEEKKTNQSNGKKRKMEEKEGEDEEEEEEDEEEEESEEEEEEKKGKKKKAALRRKKNEREQTLKEALKAMISESVGKNDTTDAQTHSYTNERDNIYAKMLSVLVMSHGKKKSKEREFTKEMLKITREMDKGNYEEAGRSLKAAAKKLTKGMTEEEKEEIMDELPLDEVKDLKNIVRERRENKNNERQMRRGQWGAASSYNYGQRETNTFANTPQMHTQSNTMHPSRMQHNSFPLNTNNNQNMMQNTQQQNTNEPLSQMTGTGFKVKRCENPGCANRGTAWSHNTEECWSVGGPKYGQRPRVRNNTNKIERDTNIDMMTRQIEKEKTSICRLTHNTRLKDDRERQLNSER